MMRSPKIPKFKPQLADSEIVKRVLLGEKELFEKPVPFVLFEIIANA